MVTTGCLSTKPNLPPQRIEQLAAMEYPADMPWGDDLDILVVRRGDRIQLVNRTPRQYQDVTLWMNQQYVRPIKQIDIGTDNTVDLRKMVSKHSEAYPVGNFFKPDKSMLLVQAELIDPTTGQRHRLAVQPPRE